MNEAFYATTQTYGLPIVHPEIADKAEDVGALAPEAGNLLTAAFPKLSLEEARDGRTRRRLSRRRIGLRHLFPAQPLCGCGPRGRALTRQALITRGFKPHH